MDKTLRIALWSAPRNVSTALMYSFAQRPDCQVIDEPLFGYFLEHTGVSRPSRDDVLNTMELDAQKVIQDQLLGPCEKPILFVKNIANHVVGLHWDFTTEFSNIILTRHPKDMLTSYIKNVKNPTMLDTAYEMQTQLYEYIIASGEEPLVLDSEYVLRNPEGVLRRLCKKLRINFYSQMLRWHPGSLKEDGIWAKHWYRGVHISTGFEPYKEKNEEIPERFLPLYEKCLPHYELLNSHAITS